MLYEFKNALAPLNGFHGTDLLDHLGTTPAQTCPHIPNFVITNHIFGSLAPFSLTIKGECDVT